MSDGNPLEQQQNLLNESTQGARNNASAIQNIMGEANSEVTAFSMNLKAHGDLLDEIAGKMLKAVNPFDQEVFEELNKYSNEVQRAFGTSKGRIDEFKKTIADVGPDLKKLGIDESAIAGKMVEVMKGLGGAASLSKEAIVELAAAQEATGVSMGTLASNFRDVGVSVYDVGERVKEVADYARSVGASVAGVTDSVSSNLKQMNLFNFDNGVKGLAKMAATSERLGLSMDKVFQTAENLMDPEKAIEMSAGLQRLGVTSSQLLDPLRAMDMAQNDPEELMKSMVDLGKEFTRFNEKTGKTEILPGAKRRLREVATELGMNADEFASMAIKASDFDMKLKQIKMPSLAEGDEETKELIATMAQMKDGAATIQVRNVETGVTTEKKVEELTPEDIENLKKANEDSSKSIEEIAFNQLDVTTQIKNLLATGEVAAKFAKGTSPTLSKFYGLVAESKLDMAKAADKVFGSTEQMREYGESIGVPLENALKARATGDVQGEKMAMDEMSQNVFKLIDQFESKVSTEVDTAMNTVIDRVKETYGKPLKVESNTESKVKIEVEMKDSPGTNNLSQNQKDQFKQELLNDPAFLDEAKKRILDGIGPSVTTGGKNK